MRRKSAVARFRWWKHRTGQVRLTVAELRNILRTLSSHHSRDVHFLQKIQNQISMERSRQGWKCGTCRIMNKKNAEYCQKCGGYWTECFEGQHQWNWSMAVEPKSPRPRSNSARRRSNAKGAGKGPGKDHSKGTGGKVAQSPFSNSYVPTPEALTPWPCMDFEKYQQAPAPAPSQPSNQSTQELVLALRKAFPESSALPQSLRDAMERAENSGMRQITKDLHAATSSLGRARKAHQEASEARSKLKSSWMKHLQERVSRHGISNWILIERTWPNSRTQRPKRSRRWPMRRRQSSSSILSPKAQDHGYLLVDSRSHPQNRSPGDRLRCRWRRERTEASQSWKSQHLSSTQGRCHFYISIGQALPCQQKVSVIKAKRVTFEIAEAYHDVDHHGAARKSRSPILSTEEAALYLHSVVHEFDYTHPFKAALNAFCLRGDLLLEVAAPNHEDIAVPMVISPHVNDLWCDLCAYGTANDPDSAGWSFPEVVANCCTCPQDSDPSPITGSENSRPQFSAKALDSESPFPRPLAHLFAIATDAQEQDKAVMDSTEDELTVYSFGYNQRYIERRCLKLRREELQRWRQLLRDQWEDHDGGHFLVHGIVPPPVLDKSTISVVLQLSEVPEHLALVLTQFIPSHGQPETPFVEAYPRRATRSIVFSICGKHTNAENTAVIKQGFKLWHAGEVQWIGHGAFIRILVDDPIDDDMGFFQTTITTFEQCKSELPFLTSRLLDERQAHRVEADRAQQRVTPHDQEDTPHIPAGTSRLYPWHLWESFFNDQDNYEEGGVQLAVYGIALESIGTRYTVLHEPSMLGT